MSCLLMRLRCAILNRNASGNVTPVICTSSVQRVAPFVCLYCKNVQIFSHHGPVLFHNTQFRYSTTYTRLRELLSASKHKRRRRPKPRYVELLQVSGNVGSPVTESLATIKKSSAAKILQKLGVTPAPLPKGSLGQKTNLEKATTQSAVPSRTHFSAPSSLPKSNPGYASSASSTSTMAYQTNPLTPMTNSAFLTPSVSSGNTKKLFVEKEPPVENVQMNVIPPIDIDTQSLLNRESRFLRNSDPTSKQKHPQLAADSLFSDILQDDTTQLVNGPITDPHSLDPDLASLKNVTNVKKIRQEKDSTKKRAKRKVTSKIIKKKAISIHPTKEFDAIARFARLQSSLASFLDVCVNKNMPKLANDTLVVFHKRHMQSMVSDGYGHFDIRLYNMVLQGWASTGNWVRVHQLLEKITTSGPKPNLRSYAAAFECVGRMDKMNSSLTQWILDSIQQNGLDISNIFVEGSFVRDQKEVVLKVIRAILPQFKPLCREKPKDYNCDLLADLNRPDFKNRFYTPAGPTVTLNKLEQAAKSQMEVELQGQVSIKSIQKRKPATEQTEVWRKLLLDCENDWQKKFAEVFSRNVTNFSRSHEKNRLSLYPYLTALDSKIYIKLMMQEVSNLGQLSEAFSPLLSVLQKNLGFRIMERYLLQKKRKDGVLDKLQLLYGKFCEYYANPSLTSKHIPRQYWESMLTNNWLGPDLETKDHFWPDHVLVGIGKFMYDIIIKNVKIDTNIFRGTKKPHLSPAFYTIYRRHDTVKIREEIKPHPLLVKLYQLANRDELIFDASILPMLSPPLPWSSLHSGGFLLSSAQLVRYPQDASRQQKTWLESLPNKQLYPVFDSLNHLSECAWVINKPILDLVIKVFNNKGSVELDIPQPTSECPLLPKVKSEMTKTEIAKVMQARSSLKQQKAEMYSLWCDMLYKLSIANWYRDQVIWFPHNMDFRGRVYPCPPHFNHLGSDVSRSLLMFAKGEPLGEVGLNWLKIHVINLTGLKKRAPLDERLAFCNEVIPDIMDSADNPLTGNKWWMQSDEPWQTLACCMELTKALRSSDPYAYVCQLPVHQDGSCNGLQHYAALGCDEQGANQVNLQPQHSPQDVYSGVADLVEQERAKDAANGLKIAQVLEGFVSRKVVKQPVMTTVYGVTRFGARLQIVRQLKDLPGFPQEYRWQAASYLVGKTFFSLQEMFSSTKHIQDWLTKCATLISQVRGEPVEWLTPLGFPIIQPYFRLSKIKQKQSLGEMSPACMVPNTRKQRNAFPPNYIHSLDSTHMMLTALFCHRAGITFVSVHDCFWTHPNSVDVMNKICREQFVSLHSQPLLKTLSEYFVKKYCYTDLDGKPIPAPAVSVPGEALTQTLLAVPSKGNFDLKQVLTSTYFFS